MTRDEIVSIVEALLFVAQKPLTLNEIKGVIEEVDKKMIVEAISELRASYERKGCSFQLVEVAEGYQFCTLSRFAPWLKRLYKQWYRVKLSRAAMETLAIVAYRQPVIRADIEDVRGVEVEGILRSLIEKKLIRIVGRKKIPGRPLLYGTTREFLEHFGLKDLSELPKLEELIERGSENDERIEKIAGNDR